MQPVLTLLLLQVQRRLVELPGIELDRALRRAQDGADVVAEQQAELGVLLLVSRVGSAKLTMAEEEVVRTGEEGDRGRDDIRWTCFGARHR